MVPDFSVRDAFAKFRGMNYRQGKCKPKTVGQVFIQQEAIHARAFNVK